MTVLDASAILAFLQGEPGADVVEKALIEGAVCSAVNWSEVAQKVLARQLSWRTTKALLMAYGVSVEPMTEADAEAAAGLWQLGSGLSIADRACLATATRLGVKAVTADKSWGQSEQIVQIR